jgi:hypothetical protein
MWASARATHIFPRIVYRCFTSHTCTYTLAVACMSCAHACSLLGVAHLFCVCACGIVYADLYMYACLSDVVLHSIVYCDCVQRVHAPQSFGLKELYVLSVKLWRKTERNTHLHGSTYRSALYIDITVAPPATQLNYWIPHLGSTTCFVGHPEADRA